MGELLTKNPRRFDPLNDLLLRDIRLRSTMVGREKVYFLGVRLKSTKVGHDNLGLVVR